MKSKRLLGFLLLALIAALIYGYLQMPRQERVKAGENKSQQRPQAIKQKSDAIGSEGYPRLRSDLLDRKSQPYPGVRRDIFSAAFAVTQIEEQVEVLIEEPPEVIAPPIVAVTPPPPSPQQVAQQEVARYKFLGFLKKGDKKTIFLATDGEILLVRKGEFLGRDRKYFVVNITDTTLELSKEGAGDFLIKLTDQESLSAVPLRATQATSVTPKRPNQEQGGYVSDLPEGQTVPDEAPPANDQLQPEEDN